MYYKRKPSYCGRDYSMQSLQQNKPTKDPIFYADEWSESRIYQSITANASGTSEQEGDSSGSYHFPLIFVSNINQCSLLQLRKSKLHAVTLTVSCIRNGIFCNGRRQINLPKTVELVTFSHILLHVATALGSLIWRLPLQKIYDSCLFHKTL
jgi:hypothetical protein